ncbi:U91 [Human betaherpesvirus 6A]|uniref:U91 n=2 Tax=root TaxID=1 RepID=A0A126LB33_HUMAN|nr:U91 [Human betaherpesvirus 6A]AMD82216.1 U91 [Homo sapiens]
MGKMSSTGNGKTNLKILACMLLIFLIATISLLILEIISGQRYSNDDSEGVTAALKHVSTPTTNCTETTTPDFVTSQATGNKESMKKNEGEPPVWIQALTTTLSIILLVCIIMACIICSRTTEEEKSGMQSSASSVETLQSLNEAILPKGEMNV